MKGRNVLRVNRVTIMEMAEEHLNRQRAAGAPKIVVETATIHNTPDCIIDLSFITQGEKKA